MNSITQNNTTQEEKLQNPFLLKSIIISVIIITIFLAFLLVSGFFEPLHAIPFGIYYLSHFPAIFFLYRKKELLGLLTISGGSTAVLISAIFLFPELKFESLFFLLVAFFGLNIRLKSGLPLIHFYILTLLCLFFQGYESYIETHIEISYVYTEINKTMFFLFIAFTMVALYNLGVDFRLVRTNLIKKEKNLETSKQQIKSIFQSALDGMFIYNLKQDAILDGNASFRELFGLGLNEMIPLGFSVLPKVQPDGADSQLEIRKFLNEVREANKTICFELIHQKINGETFLAESTIIPSSENPDELYVFIKDISTIRKTQNELKRSKHWYKSIIRSNPSGISVIKKNGDHLFASDNSTSIFGVKKGQEKKFINAFALFPSSEHEKLNQAIEEVITTKTSKSFRFQTINQTTKEDLTVSIHMALMPHFGEELLAISINEITDLVKEEKKVIEGEASLRAVMDSSPDSIYSIDRDYNILSFNNKAFEDFKTIGIILKEGANLQDITRPKIFEAWKAQVFDRIFAGETFTIEGVVESEIISKTVANFYSPVLDKNGVIIGAMETSRDITKDRLREQQIQEQKAIYEAVINNSVDGIDIVDITNVASNNPDFKGELLIRNHEMERIFNNSNSTLLHWEDVSKLFPHTQPNGIVSKDYFEDILAILMTQGLVSFPIRLHHENNTNIDTASVSQILRINGKTLLIRSYKDVSEQIMQEELIQDQLNKLNLQNEKLKTYISSNLELENFAYIASHDLQAPLRTITSFTQLLKVRLEGKLKSDEEEFMKLIVGGTKNMQELINALLAFSRVNTTKIIKKDIDLNLIFEALLMDLTSEIESCQANIIIENLPKIIQADRIKIKQLFQNLITNGIKFVPKDRTPEIVISYKESPDFWTFFVKDNGIGIKEEFQEKIFLLFKRLHTQKQFEGTGIGLALCKKLVEQHGGELSLTSVFGKGSTFSFTIPKEDLSLEE